jgi:hypothetical protein
MRGSTGVNGAEGACVLGRRDTVRTGVSEPIFCTTDRVEGLEVGLAAQNSDTCRQSISDIAGGPDGLCGRSLLRTLFMAPGSRRLENGGRPVYNWTTSDREAENTNDRYLKTDTAERIHIGGWCPSEVQSKLAWIQ